MRSMTREKFYLKHSFFKRGFATTVATSEIIDVGKFFLVLTTWTTTTKKLLFDAVQQKVT